MRQAHGRERLADERDVVGGAAAAARLRDDDGQLVGVVTAAHHGLHNLARDQDGRVADVVVHVLEARIHRAVVHRRQKLQVVAVAVEDLHQQLEVDGRHLRAQDGVAGLLHLLGEHRARELGGGALALLEALDDLGRRLLGERLGRGGELLGVEARGRAAARHALGVGLLVGLVLERRQERAHADARRAQVGHLVDLEHGVHLARALEDLLHLVGGERVEAAAEAVQLHEVEVAPLGGHLRRRVQTRMVHPLVHEADGALERAEVRDGVLGEHRQSEAGQKLGNGVVDLRVVVVGAAGQHDTVRARGLHPGERLLALRADVALERLVLGPRRVHGGVDFGLRGRARLAHELGMRLHQLHEQTLLEVLLLVVGQPRREQLHVGGAQLVDVEAQRLGVAGHDGAVEVVARTLVLLALPLAAREPDEVGGLVQQIHDVTVAELRRIAHRFGRHGLDARLVGLLRGRVGQHHAPAELREEREPERVVLVLVERARDAHAAARGGAGRKRLVAEQALALVLVEVRHRGLALVERARALLAAVSRDEATVFARGLVHAEVVDGEQAVVLARLAAHGLVRWGEGRQLLEGEEG